MDEKLQKVVNESVMDVIESTFRLYNDRLCPDLWDEYKHLDPRTRVNLLRMAYDFYERTKFSAPIIDVWLMGSIANYNWTPESDIDVHIIIDFSQLKMPPETASKVAKTAGAQWNKEHEVTIKTHKVEINIQSAKAQKPYVTGIYSLVKDQWIRFPCPMNVIVNKPLVQKKYGEMKKCVESAIKSGNREKMKKIKDYLDDFRQSGLDVGGELSVENIVYKILRSKGLVKALKDSITAVYDKEMTIMETGDLKGKNFSVKFGQIDLAKGSGKIFVGGEWFANIVPVTWDENNEGKWYINRHDGAFKMNFPNLTKYFDSPQQALDYVEDWYENREVKEVSSKDINAVHPTIERNPKYPFSTGGTAAELRLLSLSNLKALRDKSYRFLVAARKRNDEEDERREYQDLRMYQQEIKRRLDYINRSPVIESDNPEQEDADKHLAETGELGDVLKRSIQKAGNQENFNALFSRWLQWEEISYMSLGFQQKTNALNWFCRAYLKGELPITEGFGWGSQKDAAKDPLHLPGERWRIRWYTNRKTPHIKEDDLIKEVVGTIVKVFSEIDTIKK